MPSNNDTTVVFTQAQYQKIMELGNAALASIQATAANQPPPVGVWRPMYNYILGVMKADNISGPQAYWFQEAGAINADDESNSAGFFVRDITALGFGTNPDDARIQDISNAIGTNIFNTIADNERNGGSSLTFNAQLTDDINAAINFFGLPIGSWGGSFYFWNFNYSDPNNPSVTTVGQAIESSAQQTQIFVNNNAQAMADTLLKYGLVRLESDPASRAAFGVGISNLALGNLQAKVIGFDLLKEFVADFGTSQEALEFINLIGAGYGDGLGIAEGSEEVSSGNGPYALFGGQTPTGVGNDTLNGGSGADTFFFAVPSSRSATETINPLSGNGQIVVLDTDGELNVLGGSPTEPLAAVAGDSNEWQDSLGTLFSFNPGDNQLTVTDGVLGSGNQILVNNFNIEAATASDSADSGYLGLYLADVLTLTAGATAGVDPPAANFVEGSTESYTLSFDAPSSSARDITVTLSGASSSDFAALIGTTVEQLNSNGSFTVTLPAGETAVSFSLIDQTADNGRSDLAGGANLQLSASLSDPGNSTGPEIVAAPLTFMYVPTSWNTDGATPPSDVITGVLQSDGSGVTVYTGDGNSDSITTAGSLNLVKGQNSVNDSIIGSSGTNTIFGGSGNDVIVGNAGTDIIINGDGNSEIYAGSQTAISAAIGNTDAGGGTGQQGDLIAVGSGDNTIVGGDGNDLITAGAGADLIFLGSGDDTFEGGITVSSAVSDWRTSITPPSATQGYGLGFTGISDRPGTYTGSFPQPYNGTVLEGTNVPVGVANDSIYGGTGNEYIDLGNGNNYVEMGSGTDTVLGGMGNDTLIAGSGNDNIRGGGGTTYIEGGPGSDSLYGGDGDNTIIAGAGNSTIYSANGPSSDTDFANASLEQNYVYGGPGSDIIYGSSGNDTLIAGSGDTTVYGGSGNEDIKGGTGTDVLVAGSGNDTLRAGSGNDSIQAGAGSTTVFGGIGSDTIQGTTGSDLIYAGDGGNSTAPTYVLAGTGDTTVYGGAGVDRIQGGAGSNVIYAGDGGSGVGPTEIVAGSGNTTIYGGSGVDDIIGGSGTDVLYAGNGGVYGAATEVQAGSGLTTIYGGSGVADLYDIGGGSDLIEGGSGNAVLSGIGNDTLAAGSGEETLSGSGNLTYELNADSGDTTIDANGNSGTLVLLEENDSQIGIDEALTVSGPPTLDIQAGSNTVTLDDANDIAQVVLGQEAAMSLDQFVQNIAENYSNAAETIEGANGNLVFDASSARSIHGGSGQDTISAWGDNDTLSAGPVGTVIYAEGANNSVIGGDGLDTLIAYGANTTLQGGNAGETFEVNDITDVVVASQYGGDTLMSSVNYDLPTNVDVLTLTGNADLEASGNSDATNLITANSGNDYLVAGDGQDTLISGSGRDTLVGQYGGDTFVVNNSGDSIISRYGYADVVDSSVDYTLTAPVYTMNLTGADALSATDAFGYATITANSGNDTLTAGSGSDKIVTGTGVDVIVAGSGQNTFVLNNAADSIQGLYIGGADTVYASFDYTLESGVSALFLTGAANLTAQGSDGARNTITGNAGNDSLIAGSGADQLIAGTGVDTLVAGVGSDTLTGGDGDTYVLNANFTRDELVQTSGSATLDFGAGITASDLTLSLTTGSDGNPALLIQDGDAQVTVDGGLGGSIGKFDFADGSSLSLSQLAAAAHLIETSVTTDTGTITLSGADNVSLTGGVGDDTIYAFGNHDTLVAGSGNQSLYGEGAGDLLIGSTGDDDLHGGNGDDTLVAGSGNTAFYGGTETDSYVLTKGGTTTINASSSPGKAQIIVLPSGMTASDFSAYANGNNLLLQSKTDGTTAIIEGYYSGTAANKSWLITDDNQNSGFLASFLDDAVESPSDYTTKIDLLREAYSASLSAQLNQDGLEGGGGEAYFGSGLSGPNHQYNFTGVSTSNVTVSGGVFEIGSEEEYEDSVTQIQQPTTKTVNVPIYGTTNTPAHIVFVPQSGTPIRDVGDLNTNITPAVVNGVQGEYIFIPDEAHTVITGYHQVVEVVDQGSYSDTVTAGFNIINVTGDGGDDIITTAGSGGYFGDNGSYFGAIQTGNGNVSVNLNATVYDNSRLDASAFETNASKFDGPSTQLGAFIQAGNGNDYISGTGNADTIAAGTGFDYLAGGLGTEYYVPLQGDSTDIISDAYTPYGEGPFALSTLVLPTGISPGDLTYRLFQNPDGSGAETLQLKYGSSSVLVDFSPQPLPFEFDVSNNTTNASPGVNLFQFSDGTTLTRDQLIALASLMPNDFDPVVTASAQSQMEGQPVAAASLFQANDTSDNPITWYKVSNDGTGGGFFTLDGKILAAGAVTYVAADQLASLDYIPGEAGTSDGITVSAFDGAVWSADTSFSVSSGDAAGNTYAASGANQVVTGDSAGPDTLVGGFGGDTLAGASGSDKFEYTSGSGAETISDSITGEGANNKLLFGAGITPDMISANITGDPQLVLSIGSNGESVTLANFDPTDPLGSSAVQHFDFADGSSLTLKQLLLAVQGNASGTVTNADGTLTYYQLDSSSNTVYFAQSFNDQGWQASQYQLNSDGTSQTQAWLYNADESYTITIDNLNADGSVGSTKIQAYTADDVITGEQDTYADGSSSSETWTYAGDGSYSTSTVSLTAGGAASTIIQDFDSSSDLVYQSIEHPDGSIDSDTSTVAADGSRTEVLVHKAAGASTSSTETRQYNASSALISDDLVNADGSQSNNSYSYAADGSSTRTEVDIMAGSTAATTTVYSYDSTGATLGESIANPDGSSETISFDNNADGSYTKTDVQTAAGASASTTTVYMFDSTDTLSSQRTTNVDGSTSAITYVRQSDGSYSQTEVDTAAGAQTSQTITDNFNANNVLLSSAVTYTDGSTSDTSYSYGADGSYSQTEVDTAAGASASTTHLYTFDRGGRLTSSDITNTDGSTSNSSFSYASDGSHSQTEVDIASGASISTTTIYQFDAGNNLTSESTTGADGSTNNYTVQTDRSYDDTWTKTDSSHGEYWWNASTREYLETWTNAGGSSFTDEYQFASGGSPASTGISFTETYSDSGGAQGTRIYDATSGITAVSFDSTATGAISGTSANDAGFVGLQQDGELANHTNDLTYFNPHVSPTFNLFLTAHG